MPAKRKIPSMGLERRVRPRREEEWESELDASDDSSADDEVSEEDAGDDDQEDDSASSQESGSDSVSEEEPDTPKVDLSSISFGALAKAQASLLPSERQSKKHKHKDSEDETKAPHISQRIPSTKRGPAPKRTSKHAPQEQSSKRPVSRRRNIIATNTMRAPARDPRFDPVSTGAARINEAKASKAYAFLEEYRDKELADLRAQAKKTKNAAQKEELKRKIMSMESQRKARKQKAEEERVLAEHRKKEKELVAQGKTPFYLKKSEQKKQLLMNRYAGMSKGQVDKAIERKRKKAAGKEKKELDSLQRVTSRHGR